MTVNDDVTLSALVVLRPHKSGGAPNQITSQTVREHLPSRTAIEESTAYFKARGFGVTDVVAISFSIEGARSRFEGLFGQNVEVERRHAGEVVSAHLGGGELEFDLGALPKEITRLLLAVTFTPPPDFGLDKP